MQTVYNHREQCQLLSTTSLNGGSRGNISNGGKTEKGEDSSIENDVRVRILLDVQQLLVRLRQLHSKSISSYTRKSYFSHTVIYIHLYICKYIYVCIYIHIYICIYIYICKHINFVHIYTCVHAHIHTHRHENRASQKSCCVYTYSYI